MIKKDLVVIKNADLVISMDEGRRILTDHDIVISQGEIQKVEKSAILAVGPDDFEPELAYWGQHYSDGSVATFNPGDFGAQ